jgi:SAM-dependent methyltransferase
VLEVIGDSDLTAREILDIGCGRGGTVSVMAEYFRPKSVVGLDLSTSAVSFCQRNNPHGCVSYREGDAEDLPFPDGTFDVVTNIESSHSYPTISRFYQGVWRVLRAGGSFLYADLFPLARWNENIRRLRDIGFSLERRQDITENVLLSCEQTAAGKVNAYAAGNDREFMSNFLGMPDSQVYRGMRAGAWSYSIVKLAKV